MPMKKNLLLFTALLCVCIFSGCWARNQNKDTLSETPPEVEVAKPPLAAYSIAEYFPIIENTLYKYFGVGDDFLTQEAFTLFAGKNGAQILTSNAEVSNTDVYRIEDGKLKVIYSTYNYMYDNLLNLEDMFHMTVLQEPLELGSTWAYNSEGAVSEITDLTAKTTVPYGEFETLEVTTTFHDVIRIDYYAPNVGLVQTRYDLGDSIKSMDLTNVVQNASKMVEVDFCKANTTTDRLEYEKRPLVLTTNIDYTEYFNMALKVELPVDYQPLLPGDSKIKSLSVNWHEVLLTIDLTEDYVRNIGAGAGIESDALQALANTLGNFYQVRNVNILLDGKRYESGHIMRHEGEYWEVMPVLYPVPDYEHTGTS